MFPCSAPIHLPIAARHSPVDDSIFAGQPRRVYSLTPSSRTGQDLVVSRDQKQIHISSPDLSTREVVIRLLAVRLSKIFQMRLKVSQWAIKKMEIGNVPQGYHFSGLSGPPPPWNRLANKSQACLRLKTFHSSSPAL